MKHFFKTYYTPLDGYPILPVPVQEPVSPSNTVGEALAAHAKEAVCRHHGLTL